MTFLVVEETPCVDHVDERLLGQMAELRVKHGKHIARYYVVLLECVLASNFYVFFFVATGK